MSTDSHSHVVGGKGTQQPISDETKQLVMAQRSAIESAAGVDSFSTFEPVSERKQVVSGLNHFVKIKTGSNDFAHAVIWSKPDQTVHVTKVETGKSEQDPL